SGNSWLRWTAPTDNASPRLSVGAWFHTSSPERYCDVWGPSGFNISFEAIRRALRGLAPETAKELLPTRWKMRMGDREVTADLSGPHVHHPDTPFALMLTSR